MPFTVVFFNISIRQEVYAIEYLASIGTQVPFCVVKAGGLCFKESKPEHKSSFLRLTTRLDFGLVQKPHHEPATAR